MSKAVTAGPLRAKAVQLYRWAGAGEEMELCTPRVNQQLLQNYVGALVRVVGRVVQAPSNGQAVLETSDKQQVSVTLAAASIPWQDAFIEVIAKVNSDCSLQELRSTNLGMSFGRASLAPPRGRPLHSHLSLAHISLTLPLPTLISPSLASLLSPSSSRSCSCSVCLSSFIRWEFFKYGRVFDSLDILGLHCADMEVYNEFVMAAQRHSELFA